MKKLLFIFIMIFGMIGCMSDSDYIEVVKGISSDNGITVKQYVENLIDAETLYLSNAENTTDNIDFLTIYNITFNEAIKEPKNIEYTWEVEGNTDNGKIIKVRSKLAYVTIETRKRGDYIEIVDTKLYNGKNNRIVTEEEQEALVSVLEAVRMREKALENNK